MNRIFSHAMAATAIVASLAFPAVARSPADKPTFTSREVQLRTAMRQVFAEHLTWQRAVTAEFLLKGPDAQKAHDRLIRNQEDIGDLFKPFYGDDTGKKVADLFKQHVQGLEDYLNATRAGTDRSAVVTRLYWNADATADLLSTANPNWSKADLSRMFREHADLLRAEIDLQAQKPGSLDVPAMDRTFSQGMETADMLAFGIMRQYPDKLK